MIDDKQTGGQAVKCLCIGCDQRFEHTSKFLTAWCTQRSERFAEILGDMLGDQGDVGDLSAAPDCTECETDPVTGKTHKATHRCETCGAGTHFCEFLATAHAKSKATAKHRLVQLAGRAGGEGRGPAPASAAGAVFTAASALTTCAEHGQSVQFLEASTRRPLCVACLSSLKGTISVESLTEAAGARVAMAQESKGEGDADALRVHLDALELTPAALTDELGVWLARETARVKAWEERALASVRESAQATLEELQAVRSQRLRTGSSVFAQRLSLRASLDEIDYEIATAQAQAQSKKSAQVELVMLIAERSKLLKLASDGALRLPSARTINKWHQNLPRLVEDFGQSEEKTGGMIVGESAQFKKVLALLQTEKDAAPRAGSIFGKSDPSGKAPVMPTLVSS